MKNKQKKFVFPLILMITVLLAGGQCIAAEQEKDNVSVSHIISEGDALFKIYEHEKSLEIYINALEQFPDEYEILWRISRAYERIGYHKDENREENYNKSMDFARRAVEANSNTAEGHYRLAVASGRMALFKGGKTKVRLSRAVKDEVETAIAIDPFHDKAYHLLARWHHNVANLSWVLKTFAKIIYGGLPKASDEKAITYFNKAISINPNYINHHLQLGKVYYEMKLYTEAKDELKLCMELPVTEEDDEAHKKEALDLYNKIKLK